MSHFLQNLIDRHQVDGVNPKANHIVQPRPKARFETNSGTGIIASNELENSNDFTQPNSYDPDIGSTLTHEEPETKPITTDSGKQSSQQSQVQTQPSIDKPITQSNSSHRIGDLNERIEALKLQFGQKPSVLEITDRSIYNQSNQQSKEEPKSPINSKHSDNHNLSLTDEVNQRIQSILQHLNSQQKQRTDEQRTIESQHDPELSDTGNNSSTGVVPSPLRPETTSDFVQSVIKVKEQNTENRSKQYESHQSGLLQTPDWLTEMQADLNKRWQEINTQAEAESVVNVTIGRVEVRAIQAESSKQPKNRNKPSGVMSLDDYLKQRESRGRA